MAKCVYWYNRAIEATISIEQCSYATHDISESRSALGTLVSDLNADTQRYV